MKTESVLWFHCSNEHNVMATSLATRLRIQAHDKGNITALHCGRVLWSIYGHHLGCLNYPIFSNLGLCAACWARFMCHIELRPTSVSHPFSSLYSSLSFTGGKHYLEITIPIFRLVVQISLFQVAFLIFFSMAIYFLYFLLDALKLRYVALFQSRELVKFLESL